MSVSPVRTPLIWGGERARYAIWWGLMLIASIALPGTAALWFNSHGRGLPGGAYNLLLFVAVLLGWPCIAIVMRMREIRRKRRIEAAEFEVGVADIAAGVPAKFALAVRSALAAAYCVPAELIGYADTRRNVNLFTLINEPLAIEVIAHVCRTQGIQLDHKRLVSAAEGFTTHRPSNVRELIELLHKEMLSVQLIAQ